jgi:hypothetical protein
LIESAELCILDPSDIRNREVGYLFDKFRKDYAALFAARHDEIMRDHHLQEKFTGIKASDGWNEYNALANSGFVDIKDRRSIQTIATKLSDLDCRFDVGNLAIETGSCQCSFSLETADSWLELPDNLMSLIDECLGNIRIQMTNDRDKFVRSLEDYEKDADADLSTIAGTLRFQFENGTDPSSLTVVETSVLRNALADKRHFVSNHQIAADVQEVESDNIEVMLDSIQLVEV